MFSYRCLQKKKIWSFCKICNFLFFFDDEFIGVLAINLIKARKFRACTRIFAKTNCDPICVCVAVLWSRVSRSAKWRGGALGAQIVTKRANNIYRNTPRRYYLFAGLWNSLYTIANMDREIFSIFYDGYHFTKRGFSRRKKLSKQNERIIMRVYSRKC